jgi:uncharacterized protein YndB with AHSA1/START domain
MTATADANANEIAITRFYDAPVQMVWDAWTDPEQVAQWWGPRGFTLTTHSKDLRPGGSWVYTMHGPDGVDYPNDTKYIEVVPLSRLVYDHGASDGRPPLFRVTVDFTDEGGTTRMDMRMTLPSPQAARDAKKFIREAGGNSTWDRLAEYLEKEATGKEIFVINHTFDAPVDVLSGMWSVSHHPISPVSPERMLTNVEFAAETPNRTRVTVTSEIRGAPTPDEAAVFGREKGAMTRKWMGSFEKVEALLEETHRRS